MKTLFFNYLRFSRSERNGTIALLLLATLFFSIPEIMRRVADTGQTDFEPFEQETRAFQQQVATAAAEHGNASGTLFAFDPNLASFDDLVRLGLSERVAQSICNYRNKGGSFRAATDFKKIWGLKPGDFERLLPYIHLGVADKNNGPKKWEKGQAALFEFDPNTASEADFEALGLPRWTIKSILNYRDKGGKFRKKEDLEKIYTLGEEDYARISAYVKIEAAMAVAEPPRPAAYAGGAAGSSRQKPASGPVDINRASLEMWATLPGIGPARARQLVNFRERLGGFVSVEQVSEMYGLPDSIFQRIRSELIFTPTPLHTINLNTASVEDLDAHPYITRKQAQQIVAYREQHGPFASPEALGNLRALADPAWLAKVRAYVSVE